MSPGGKIFVDGLAAAGVDRVFCVPGESFLPLLDALHDTPQIQLIVCRHEGAAAFMAEADAKLTGRPGVCFVSRGPGATHASVGVHTAFQDSTPLVVVVGQIPRAFTGREAFQELDCRKYFGPIAKAVYRIERASALAGTLAKAMTVAVTGRQGPVVLEIPEDVLREEAEPRAVPRRAAASVSPIAPAHVARIRRLLQAARRPVLILGGSGWTEGARADLVRFAEANALPVAVTFRRQQLFDHLHPQFIGHLGFAMDPGLASRIKAADLLLVVGSRLGEAATGSYRVIEPPRPRAKLIHLYPSAGELGRVYRPTLGVVTPVAAAAAALAQMAPLARPSWKRELVAAHAGYLNFSTPSPAALAGTFQLTHVLAAAESRLPADAIVTSGAGTFTIWVHRFHRHRRFGTQLAPTYGTMGYGVPAAIAAQLRRPGATVVCFTGDGDFMMYPQEVLHAVEHRLPIVFIVINNGMLGSIRAHQENRYPGRVSGTDLFNPDFAAVARAWGFAGTVASDVAGFERALDDALRRRGPALIEVRVDRRQLTPDQRIVTVEA